VVVEIGAAAEVVEDVVELLIGVGLKFRIPWFLEGERRKKWLNGWWKLLLLLLLLVSPPPLRRKIPNETTFEAFDFEGDAAVDVDEGGAIIIYSALIFSTFGFFTKLRPFTFLWDFKPAQRQN
jgi:hypothetical protein